MQAALRVTAATAILDTTVDKIKVALNLYKDADAVDYYLKICEDLLANLYDTMTLCTIALKNKQHILKEDEWEYLNDKWIELERKFQKQNIIPTMNFEMNSLGHDAEETINVLISSLPEDASLDIFDKHNLIVTLYRDSFATGAAYFWDRIRSSVHAPPVAERLDKYEKQLGISTSTGARAAIFAIIPTVITAPVLMADTLHGIVNHYRKENELNIESDIGSKVQQLKITRDADDAPITIKNYLSRTKMIQDLAEELKDIDNAVCRFRDNLILLNDVVGNAALQKLDELEQTLSQHESMLMRVSQRIASSTSVYEEAVPHTSDIQINLGEPAVDLTHVTENSSVVEIEPAVSSGEGAAEVVKTVDSDQSADSVSKHGAEEFVLV